MARALLNREIGVDAGRSLGRSRTPACVLGVWGKVGEDAQQS
jgi:hypothetical protein